MSETPTTVYVASSPIEPYTHEAEILEVRHCGQVVLYDDERVILGATTDGTTPCPPAHGCRAAFIANADPADTRPAVLRFATSILGYPIHDIRSGGGE